MTTNKYIVLLNGDIMHDNKGEYPNFKEAKRILEDEHWNNDNAHRSEYVPNFTKKCLALYEWNDKAKEDWSDINGKKRLFKKIPFTINRKGEATIKVSP